MEPIDPDRQILCGGGTFLLKYVVGVLAVFVICAAIKLAHKYTVERLYKNSKKLSQLGDKLDGLYGKLVFVPPDEEKR